MRLLHLQFKKVASGGPAIEGSFLDMTQRDGPSVTYAQLPAVHSMMDEGSRKADFYSNHRKTNEPPIPPSSICTSFRSSAVSSAFGFGPSGRIRQLFHQWIGLRSNHGNDILARTGWKFCRIRRVRTPGQNALARRCLHERDVIKPHNLYRL